MKKLISLIALILSAHICPAPVISPSGGVATLDGADGSGLLGLLFSQFQSDLLLQTQINETVSPLSFTSTITLANGDEKQVNVTGATTSFTVAFSGGPDVTKSRTLHFYVTTNAGSVVLNFPSSKVLNQVGFSTSRTYPAGLQFATWFYVNGEYYLYDSLLPTNFDIPTGVSPGAATPTAGNIDLTATEGQTAVAAGAITSITMTQGDQRLIVFTGSSTVTAGGSLVLPGGATSIPFVAGDYAIVEGGASSVTTMVRAFHQKSQFADINGGYVYNITGLSFKADLATYANFFNVFGNDGASRTVQINANDGDRLLNLGADIVIGPDAKLVTSGGQQVNVSGTNTGDQSSIDYSAALGFDNTYNGATITGLNAGATIAQFEVVYLGGSSTWLLADCNGVNTYPARGMAVASKTNGQALTVLANGTVRHDAWNFTPGGTLYLSGTPGAITQTAPSASNDKVEQIGFALTADIAYINFGTGETVTVQ